MAPNSRWQLLALCLNSSLRSCPTRTTAFSEGQASWKASGAAIAEGVLQGS
jgi:hypothetical protein